MSTRHSCFNSPQTMCPRTLKISTLYEVLCCHLYRYFLKIFFCFAVNSTIHKATDWFGYKENKFILAHDSGSEQLRGHIQRCFHWQSPGRVESIPCRRQGPFVVCVCLLILSNLFLGKYHSSVVGP